MIVDDLAEAMPAFRRIAEASTIVRVPFDVFPYHDSDGRPGLLWTENRIPKTMIRARKDGGLFAGMARPTFQRCILVGEHRERGCAVVWDMGEASSILGLTAETLSSRSERGEGDIGKALLLLSVGMSANGMPLVLAGIAVYVGDGIAPAGAFGILHAHDAGLLSTQIPDERERLRALSDARMKAMLFTGMWARLMSGLPLGDLKDLSSRLEATMPEIEKRGGFDGFSIDCEGMAMSAVTAFSLMNCRNIVLTEAIPDPMIQRARNRRGQRPLFSYRTIRVKAPSKIVRGKTGARNPAEATDGMAVHLVRGHFKTFGIEKPLFGSISGTFWWQPHLAGQGPGISRANYAVEVDGPQN